MANVEKKIWPEFFDAVKSGKKNYELRIADFEINPGDTLTLKEWDPKTKSYTGRQIVKRVGNISQFSGKNFFVMFPKQAIEKEGLYMIELK